MFSLSLPNYQSSPKQGIAPFTTLETTTNYQPAWQWQPNLEIKPIAITEPTILFDRVIFSIPSEAETVTTAKVGEVTYSADEFEIDSGTNQITITLDTPVPENVEIIVFAIVAVPPRTASGGNPQDRTRSQIRTTEICNNYPLVLSEINAEGNISFSRSLSGHPNASFSFYACSAEEETVRDQLCNGVAINLFGVPFLVNSLSITRVKQTDYIQVQVSLIGKHSPRNSPSLSPLDRPVRLVDLPGNRGFGNDKQASLKSIAGAAGVSYSGSDVKWWLPINLSSAATTRFRNEFESKIAVNGQFPFYSGEVVTAKTWGQTDVHYLSSADVLSNEVISVNGHGKKVDGVKLSREYRNAVLKLDFSNIPLDGDKQVVTLYEFENTNSRQGARSPSEETTFGSYAPSYLSDPENNPLRDPNNNFDSGGFSKTVRKKIYVNGLITLETEEVFGYVFSTKDTYIYRLETNPATEQEIIKVIFTNPRPSTYWEQVKSTTKTYSYNKQGYLTGERMTGWQVARYKQESENLEAIYLMGKAEQANEGQTGLGAEAINLIKESEHYEFTAGSLSGSVPQKLPVRQWTTYLLSRFSDYYPDIVPPHYSGDWIEPLFARKKVTYQNESIFKESESYDENKVNKPLVTGKRFKEEIVTTITKSTRPEIYQVQHYTKQEEGSYFKNAAKIRTNSSNRGRPPIHTRLDRFNYSQAFLAAIDEHKRYKNTKFFASTGQVSKIEDETISFPGIYDLGKVTTGARTRLSIENTRNAETLTIDTTWHPEMKEGDKLWYKNRLYIILGINATISIEKGRLRCDRFSLNLGRYLNPGLNVVKRSVASL